MIGHFINSERKSISKVNFKKFKKKEKKEKKGTRAALLWRLGRQFFHFLIFSSNCSYFAAVNSSLSALELGMSLASTAASRLRCCAASSRLHFFQFASASTQAQTNLPESAFRPPPERAPDTWLRSRIKPVPSSFFTAKSKYVDTIILLEDLAKQAKRALDLAHFPTQNLANNPSAASMWLKGKEMSTTLGLPLKASQYRQVLDRLRHLQSYRKTVKDHFLNGQFGNTNKILALKIEDTLNNFSKDGGTSSELEIDTFYSKSTRVDEMGRAYARGRRKESSARIWIAPKEVGKDSESESLLSQSILINLETLPEVFTRINDRQTILHPLRLTGMIGVVNVFALVTGGGKSGQAGAISHGIARALVTYLDHQAKQAKAKDEANAGTLRGKAYLTRKLLEKDGVLIRDPRMVERKKTGLAKARKAYTWVKR